MTGNYRYQFLPQKLDLTPNCATLIKMESNRNHQKISITVKNQNYLDKCQFDEKIGKILKEELLRKRKKLDRRSNLPILSKTKPDWTDPEIQRSKWSKFVVS